MSKGSNNSFILKRHFLPLFITQFLGAFNDNLFRQAIIILITFGLAQQVGMAPAILNNLAVGFFILPYFLFSALAGQLADKYEKAGQIFWIKIWEVALMCAGALALYFSSLPLLIAVLAGLGLQSTFFGPIKYGILPDLVQEKELLTANSVVEAGTFIAILLGTIIGGLLMKEADGWFYLSTLTISVALIGTLSGRMVPKTGRAAPNIRVRANIFSSTGKQLKIAWKTDVTRRSIVGISWIWLYGSIYISQMPVVAKDHLGGDETVVTLFMACFSVGIGVGSFLCSKLLKGVISARLSRPALLLLLLLSLILYATLPAKQPDTTPLPVAVFLTSGFNWFIVAILTLTAIFAGMIIVPMYAILQHETPRSQRSRMIAANNIINSGFMAGGSLLAAALIASGLSTTDVLLIFGGANLLILSSARKLEKMLPA